MQAGRTRDSTADSCKKESLTDDEIPLGLAVSRSSGMFCEFLRLEPAAPSMPDPAGHVTHSPCHRVGMRHFSRLERISRHN